MLRIPFLIIVLLTPPVVFLAASQNSSVQGIVTAEQTPIRGAVVRYQGTTTCTRSDKNGRFQLPSPTKKQHRITTWKAGYAIAAASVTNRPLKLTLLPLPKNDHDKYRWLDPRPKRQQANNCGNCHAQIYREWQGSGHSRAVTNRRLQNLFAGTDWHGKPSPQWSVQNEHPLGAAVCATCHAPTFRDANLEYDLRKVTGVAKHGVHCDYCHKIVKANADPRGLTFGKDGYELLRPRGDPQLFFGPLDDAYRKGEMFGYASFYKESRYCASCHEGVVFGVHVYGTYSEWLKSPARRRGLHCQNCHMKPSGKFTNIAPGHGGIERDPKTLASHDFPGATPAMLRRCLSVETRWQRRNNNLNVTVTVTPRDVGHRVPTGFLDRHVLLVVEALDRTGKAVALRKGAKLPAAVGKEMANVPGRLFGKLLHDRAGHAPIPFWRPHGKIVDTRLHPEKTEHSRFVFDENAVQLRVRLLYRRFWRDVARSKSWPDDTIVVVDRRYRP